MPANVLHSTRPQQVVVTCFKHPWQLHLATASDWLGAIAWDYDTLAGVFPGAIADSEVDHMWRLGMENADAFDRWRTAARVAVARGSGRDWWWTVNLTRRVMQSWPHFNGMLLLQQVDAETLRFPLWLDAAYMLLWERTDEEGRMKLDMELSLPPLGVSPSQAPAAAQQMMSAFAAD